jgi:hypothetical protein
VIDEGSDRTGAGMVRTEDGEEANVVAGIANSPVNNKRRVRKSPHRPEGRPMG